MGNTPMATSDIAPTPAFFIRLIADLKSIPSDTPIVAASAALTSKYPGLSERSLKTRITTARRASTDLFRLYLDGKISLSVFEAIAYIDPGKQMAVAERAVAESFFERHISAIHHYLKEGRSVEEAVGRATGKIRNGGSASAASERNRTLDTVLDDAIRMGTRWRATIAMAMDAASSSENAQGVHLALFEKVYLLRHLIKEQYDFVDKTVARYLDALTNHQSTPPVGSSPAEGEGDIAR